MAETQEVDLAEEAAKAELQPKLTPIWFNRDYMLLWSGQVISTLGSSASGIVFPLLILSLTGSPQAAGIAGALGAIPYLIFSLPVGALVDRWDRKLVMILCDTGRALTLASIPIALFFDVLTIWQIFIAAFIEGTLFVFFNIAEVAALPRVVPKAQLPEATAQNQAAFAVAGITGPSIGTFLYQTVGHMAPFIADAISYIVSVISLFFIKTKFQLERAQGAAERHLGREIKEGLQWLWGQPLIRFMAFLTGGANFVNSATGLIWILLAKNLGADDGSIGIMFSIASVGGIFGSLIGGRIHKRFTFGQVIISIMWMEALLFPLLLFAPNIYVIGALGALMFSLVPIYNVVQFSYRVALIPDELQGRVNSTFRLIAFGFQPLGAFIAGFLLERYDVWVAVLAFSAWEFMLAVLASVSTQVRNAKPLEEAQPA